MIVTSVPLVPDLDDESDDKWSGFPEQRAQILQAIDNVQNPKVVFISGDVHCSYVAQIVKPGHKKPSAYQVVSSSFFWPYPHMEKSNFGDGNVLKTIKDGEKYVASFVTDVHSDDNFARLDIATDSIEVSFFKRKGDQLGSSYKIVF